MKPEILPVLLKIQAEEITKGREEEKKKKAEAQAKAAAAKKEGDKKKEESSKEGGESSTAGAGQTTSVEACAASPDATVSPGNESERMQVEQHLAIHDLEATAATEQGSLDEASVLVSMSMDEPLPETSASLSDQAMVRTSTPANESGEPPAAVAAITPPATIPVSSVVQDIISAATLEASSLNTNDVVPLPSEVSDNPQVSTTEEEGADQETAHAENNGSPMALGDEGTGAAIISEPTQNAPAPAFDGMCVSSLHR